MLNHKKKWKNFPFFGRQKEKVVAIIRLSILKASSLTSKFEV